MSQHNNITQKAVTSHRQAETSKATARPGENILVEILWGEDILFFSGLKWHILV